MQSKMVVIIALLLIVAGCGNKSALLVNTWKVQDLKYTKEITPELQPQIDRAIEGIRQSFRLTYKADGTYTTQNNNDVLTGQWSLNWNSTVITSRSSKGETKDYKIVELSKDKFTFKAEENGEEVIFEMIPAN